VVSLRTVVVEMEGRGDREVSLGDRTKSREWQGRRHSGDKGCSRGKNGDNNCDIGWMV
jgi:hypothetical protein